MNSPVAFNAKQGFSSYYWDFGDGTYSYPSSLASHTYSRSGTYFVVLSAYNNTGVYSTASHIVVVGSGALAIDFSFPTSNIATGPVTASTGSPVAFNATATGGPSPYTFTWNFGDGLTASGNTATHVFFTAGAYTVVLTTTDAGGVIATASHYVIVVSTFHVDFSLHHVSTGSPTSFNATLGLSQYYWDFGDGGTYFNYGSSNGAFATHTYSRSGTYFVILTAYNNTGVYSTASHLLVVSSSVVAVDFSFPTYSVAVGPVTASTGSPVAFNVTSVQGGTPPYAFAWDFGDGNLAVGSSLTHTFTGPGIYTIVLTTTDSNNVKATASRFVLVQSTPRIDFVSFPTVTAGSPTVFNATTPGFSSYYWDFGDGTYSYPSSLASHTYSRSGTYFVVLSGYNNTGVYSTASHVVIVGAGVVAADFLYPTTSVIVGAVYPSSDSPVVFNATATGGVLPYTFTWDFGDGSTATGSTVTHVFSAAGIYIVVLTVTDAGGARAVASHFVNVVLAPPVDFSYPLVSMNSPAALNAKQAFSSYSWDSGDGTYSYPSSLPSYTHSRSGTYFVVLSAFNNTGVYSTASHIVVVGSGALAIDFSFPTYNVAMGPVTASTGSPVAFNVTAVQGPTP